MMKLRVAFTVACIMAAGAADAATYYVSGGGSDYRSCEEAQSPSAPRETIGGGLQCLTAGDTLLVRGGTYNEAINNNVPSGTSWEDKVRVAAYPGETVWLAPQPGVGPGYVVAFEWGQRYIEIDGLNMNGSQQPYAVVKVETSAVGYNTHHIRVQNAELIANPNTPSNGVMITTTVAGSVGGHEFINLTVHGGGLDDFNHGFYVMDSDTLVDHCLIYDWPGAGVQIENVFGVIPRNVVVRNNTIRDLRSTGRGQRHWGVILAGGAASTMIYNNIIYNIPDDGGSSAGILVYSGSDTKIYNNTLYNAAGVGEGISLEYGATNSAVINNIASGHRNDFYDGGSRTTSASNLFYGAVLFVDAASGLFELQPQSAGVDSGASLPAVTTDVAGTARPHGGAYDIGAYDR